MSKAIANEGQKKAEVQQSITNDGKETASIVPEVGILFVHGIGEQKRGETLLQFGEPLYRWVESWLNRTADDTLLESRVSLAETTLMRPHIDEPNAPASMIMKIKTPASAMQSRTGRGQAGELTGQAKGEEHHWLLAESWWAGDFPAPKLGEVVKWAVFVGPSMVGRDIVRRIEVLTQVGIKLVMSNLTGPVPDRFGLIKPFLNLIRYPLVAYLVTIIVLVHLLCRFGVFLVVSTLQLLMFALLILSVVPPLRTVISGLQLWLIGSLGDSYTLATSPVRYDAMVSQVQRDIRWLIDRKGCKKVAVIAHSQGAAVAHAALKEERPQEVQMLVTFGSGLGKLHILRKLVNRSSNVVGSLTLRTIGISLFVIAMLVVTVFREPFLQGVQPYLDWTNGSVVTWLLSVLALGAFYLLYETGHWLFEHQAKQLTSRDLYIQGQGQTGGLTWLDMYAPADIVSDGPLPSERQENKRGLKYVLTGQREEGSRSKEVANLHSFQMDHDVYWQNREQFAAPIISQLVRMAGWELTEGQTDDTTFKYAAYDRRKRVRALCMAGILGATSVPLAAYFLWDWLLRAGGIAGNLILAVIPFIPHPDLGDWDKRVLGSQEAAQVIGLALLVIVFMQWHSLCVRPTWFAWDRREAERMFRRNLEKRDWHQAGWFLATFAVFPLVSCIGAIFPARGIQLPLALIFWLLAFTVLSITIWIGAATWFDLISQPNLGEGKAQEEAANPNKSALVEEKLPS